MKYVIISGRNEDAFFVQVNVFIGACEEEGTADTVDISLMDVSIWESSESFAETAKKIQSAKKEGIVDPCSIIQHVKSIISSGESYKYYLYLHDNPVNQNNTNTYDVIPLRLFLLMRRKYKDKILLGIENITLGDSQRISSYMFIDNLSEMNNWKGRYEKVVKKGKEKRAIVIDRSDLSRNKLYNQILLLKPDGKKPVRLSLHGIGSLNKIIPCLCLDWEWYAIFVDTVGNCFGDSIGLTESCAKNLSIEDDYIYKLQAECARQNRSTRYDNYYVNHMQREEWRRLLYQVIIKDICVDNLKDGRVLDKNDTHELHLKCKNMSMLSLLLFSSFCHFIYETTKMEISDVHINNLLQSAQDFGDGLIQLIENALEYAEQSCFSFRIHNGDSDYLKKNYGQFQVESDTYYLEVILTDINYNSDIVEKFKHNLAERRNNQEIPEKLANEITQEISLPNFFRPDDKMQKLWDEYYQIAENATNHYGLQLFDSLVSYYNGYFEVNSCSKDKKDPFCINYTKATLPDQCEVGHKKYLPGTQYSIILPIKYWSEQKRVGIHTRPDFSDVSLKNGWENNNIEIADLFAKVYPNRTLSHQLWKKENIRAVAEACSEKYKKKQIYVIDVSTCNNVAHIELFSKGMISFVLKKQGEKLRIALINADYDFMIGFTRFFSIFYNKNGVCIPMKSAQIFLCDKELKTEVVFSGESLESACASNIYWANAKGEFNSCVEMLQIILAQRVRDKSRKAVIKRCAPFELMIKSKESTLFEKRVYSDLMADIQKEQFGCCLNHVHMRVGSKMHVTNHFFETFQLFNSSLYNTRFAYLIARKIDGEMNERKISRPIVLIGYDIYSELLLIETKKILTNIFKKEAWYTVFEQTETEPVFRLWENYMSEGAFAIIVPTNTTLTTHGKIIVELGKKTGKGKNISEDILLNIAVILIRDSCLKKPRKSANELSEIEMQYWSNFDADSHEVSVKTASPETVSYNVLVESNWQEPLTCESCYPSDNLLDEKPIIEVNRSSVVPMVMAGPTESSLNLGEENEDYPKGDISDLKSVLYYGHSSRKNNHFEFYFRTEQLIKNITNEKNADMQSHFFDWLKYVKKEVEKQKKEQQKNILEKTRQNPYIYDILVAPIHETNAGFMEIISDRVFDEIPIVLYIDSDREYRDNILSKYSNLTALYYNTLGTGRQAVINFHYIDDSMNSGTSFRRTHNLLRSLFPDEAYDEDAKVQINLFQNVILLINRNSKDTIKDYILNGNFFAYYYLKISPLRNHHDKACALCSKVADYQKLERSSAVCSMALYWSDKVKENDIEDAKTAIIDEEKQDENYRKMVCTHEINGCLSKMGTDKNITTEVQKALVKIICERLYDVSITDEERLQYSMTYFEVLSKPYLIYRKSILDVIFPIILEIMELVLNNNTIPQNRDTLNDVQKIGADIIELMQSLPEGRRKEMHQRFVKVMINSLSELNACYLMRIEVINKLVRFMEDIGYTENSWALLYGAAIKRVITLNKDETTGLWLEYLLLTNHEYQKENGAELNIGERFRDLLFYENISIISDAVTELWSKGIRKSEDIDGIIEEYYFDNYRKLLSLDYDNHSLECIDIKGNDKWHTLRETLCGMVKLKAHLNDPDQNDPATFYPHLLRHIQEIARAKYVFMYGIDKQNHVYIIGGTDENIYSRNDFLDIEGRRNETGNSDYLSDTVFIDEGKTALIRITGGKTQTEDEDSVWLFIEFPDMPVKEKEEVNLQYKFAIRNILIHRYELLKRLKNDFKKDAFNRIKELSIKTELLSKSKAGSHTPDSDLQGIADKLYAFEENNNGSEAVKWAGALLQLASDSLVSKLYVECIRDEGSLNEGGRKVLSYNNKFQFSPTIVSLLEKMSFINKNRGVDEPTTASIKLEGDLAELACKFPEGQYFYVLFIIAAIVQNAVRHGRADNDGKVHVTISRKDSCLLIKNISKDGWKFKGREEHGITIKALIHFFKKYYGEKLDENISPEGEYTVVLPILYTKERKTNEKDIVD